jgi:uncharacterized protein (DUF362 family)
MQGREQEKLVAAVKGAATYGRPPYGPGEFFAELQGIIKKDEVQRGNVVYGLVRECLHLLGLDDEHYGTAAWSPLRGLAREGQRVVIKPNLVYHQHPLGSDGFIAMVTQAEVLRPIIDYVLKATGGEAEVIICDAPLQSAEFDMIVAAAGYCDLQRHYKNQGVDIRIIDLRKEVAITNEEGVIARRQKQKGDPEGYAVIDLKDKSEFFSINALAKRLEITDYPLGTVYKHHNERCNEYLISRTVLSADLFINIPKLKTHKKAGITAAMKNLIGINGDKSWIAHHRRGGPSQGGDEYDRCRLIPYLIWHFDAFLKNHRSTTSFATLLRKIYRKIFWGGKSVKEMSLEFLSRNAMEGSWFGNDTLWRTIVDLNNILFFADKEGQIRNEPQRSYLAIVDGIIAGEKNGPMEHLPKQCGSIIGGFNPVAVDYVAATLMGFDYSKIPQINRNFVNSTFKLASFYPEEIQIRSLPEAVEALNFQPPSGWEGHIEIAPAENKKEGRKENVLATREHG